MTLSNLSILIFCCAISLFVLSQFAKRGGANNATLPLAVKVLSAITLTLAAVYFYKRFVG